MREKPEHRSSCGLRYSLWFVLVCEQVKDPDEPESKKSKGSSPRAEDDAEDDETLELDEHPEEVSSVFCAVCGIMYLTPFAWCCLQSQQEFESLTHCFSVLGLYPKRHI